MVQNGAAKATEDEEGWPGLAGLHHPPAQPGAPSLLVIETDHPSYIRDKRHKGDLVFGITAH